jgi:hypothetical protein
MLGQSLGGLAECDDLAVGENIVSRDMIIVPMAQHHADRSNTAGREVRPDEARMGQRNMRVVDKGFTPAHN